MKKYQNLIDVQEEYIKFLEREVGSVSSIACVHGWNCTREIFEKGENLRKEIEKRKEDL